MKLLRRVLAYGLSALTILNVAPNARACGPSSIEPIFVFTQSPDLPFAAFVKGKIGIIRPTFGRKTLTIAYRYLNGGSFTSDEQAALVEALSAKASKDSNQEPLKNWILARKEFLTADEKLPEIYVERQRDNYDFFPNCSSNAFGVATETLKDRIASYGADDRNVRTWITTQDVVFQNCAGGAGIPEELGKESPEWLRKDREYQIGAALFYSLKFDEARARFEKIAADNESPWQATADYLVARTLVRHASFTESEAQGKTLYSQAEAHLQILLGRSGNLNAASQRLLALVKYRLHPEERLGELGRILAYEGGNDNLRQDLIDYVWLIDKFEAQIMKQREKEKAVLKTAEEKARDQEENAREADFAKLRNEERERLSKGETLEITIYPKTKDGQTDYRYGVSLQVNHDVSEAEILQDFELKLGKKLSPEEEKLVKEAHAAALSYRQYNISPNRKWDAKRFTEHKGCNYDCETIPLASIPRRLRSEDLTDWILTFQSADPRAYGHALSRWRATKSLAWLAAVMAKADKSSPQLESVMRQAEGVSHDSPGFPTIAYHLIRLRTDMGRNRGARKLLDEILSWQSDILPVSAQNQFAEQRMKLADNVSDFLKFAERLPVAFYEEGRLGKLSDLLEMSKRSWNPLYHKETEEEFQRELEATYKDLLPWDERVNFDEKTIDILNSHFPLTTLAEISGNPILPQHLQRSVVLAAWVRAIVLKNNKFAQRMAHNVPSVAPELGPLFESYLNASKPKDRDNAALYILLKSPNLSPFIQADLPLRYGTSEEFSYYFETAWWCRPSETDWTNQGIEVQKVVAKPSFLTPLQLAVAHRERAELLTIADAKSYLGKQAIEWAKSSPNDPRVPEALFIAVKANSQYKYGCDGWEFDRKTQGDAETLLRKRYPDSPWTAKLETPETP